jgi:hypothetical protein
MACAVFAVPHPFTAADQQTIGFPESIKLSQVLTADRLTAMVATEPNHVDLFRMYDI